MGGHSPAFAIYWWVNSLTRWPAVAGLPGVRGVGQLPDSRWVNSVTRPWVNYLTVHTHRLEFSGQLRQDPKFMEMVGKGAALCEQNPERSFYAEI